MRRCIALVACALLLAAPSAAEQAFDPKPWLDDLAQMRAALTTKYANIEWAITDRGADLDDYFGRARKRILRANDAGSAMAAFDGLIRRLGDGHVEIAWPQHTAPSAASVSGQDVCKQAGYDAAKPRCAPGCSHDGIHANPRRIVSGVGTVQIGSRRIGILKIGLFSPEGMPELCRAALAALKVASERALRRQVPGTRRKGNRSPPE